MAGQSNGAVFSLKNSGQERPKIVLFKCDQKHTSNTGLSLTTAYDKNNTLPPYWQALLLRKCPSIRQISCNCCMSVFMEEPICTKNICCFSKKKQKSGTLTTVPFSVIKTMYPIFWTMWAKTRRSFPVRMSGTSFLQRRRKGSRYGT